MTADYPWQPGADPSAETQATRNRPGAHLPPQQAAGLDATMFMANPSIPGPRPEQSGGMNRRRMLFSAGGIMLLAGGGGAAAAAMGASKSPRTGGSSRAGSASTPGGPSSPAAPATSVTTPPTTTPTTPPATTGNGTVATKPIYYVDDQGPMAIALTLDDGPHPTYTPQVLEILASYNIKATFNMIGQQIHPNLSLVREVAAAGHTITNHTWSHDEHLYQRTYAQVCSEIDRCNDALADAGQHPTIFRAPGGNWGTVVYEACASRNLRPVDWSVDPRDWDSHVTTSDIVQNVMTHTHAHDIIIEHDGGGDRHRTVAALKQFIPQLLEKGFNFVVM